MSYYQPPQPPQAPRRKAGKIAGFSCLGMLGVFILLAIIGNLIDDPDETAKAEDKPTAAASSPEPSEQPTEPAEPPKEETPEPSETPKEKKDNASDDTWPALPGASIEQWSTTMRSDHGIAFSKEAQKEPKVDGVPDRRTWAGQAKTGTGFTDPSYTAEATATTSGGMFSASCAAAGDFTKDDHAPQAAFLAGCVTGAGVKGVDSSEVDAWVQKSLPGMLGEEGLGDASTELGPLTLRMTSACTAWCTASIRTDTR